MMLGSGYSHKGLGVWPTQAALTQHIKRASYQAYCWNMATMYLVPELPNPEEVER